MIYAIGDSYTYGEELADPADAWPTVVGAMLNEPVVNLGRSGSGNHRIVKRSIDCVLNGSASLLLIAWANPCRREFSDEFGTYTVWPANDWSTGSHTHRNALARYITAYDNEEYYYTNWLREVILVQQLCRANGVKVIMSMVNIDQLYKKYHKQHEDLIKHVDHANFIGWPNITIAGLTDKLAKGPNGHPLQEGHKLIAEKYYEIAKHIRP